jgi:signal transduction histidine kinase
MRTLVLYLLACLAILPRCVRAQQEPQPIPLTNFATTQGLAILDSPSYYLDSQRNARAGTIQDIATVRDKEFTTTWPRFYEQLSHNARPYTFWFQTVLQNNSDSALDLSLAYGSLDFVDAWLLPETSTIAGPNSSRPDRAAPRKITPDGSPHSARTTPDNGTISPDRIASKGPPQTARAASLAAPQYIPGGSLRPAPTQSTYLQRQSQTLPLRLSAHATARLLIRVRQLTDDYYFHGFALYDQRSLSATFVDSLAEDHTNLIIQMLFQGFLLCQLIYVLFQWLIIRRQEYLFYLFYMTLIAGYFLSKQESLFGFKLLFTRWPLLKIYLGKTLLILPYYVYFRFVRSFLDIPRDYPRLNTWIIRLEYFLLAYALFDFLFILLTFNRGLQTILYTIVFSLIFLISLGFVVFLVRYRQPLVYFILAGSLVVATGHILGLVFSYLEIERHMDLGVPDIFVFPQTGIVLEILCFTGGLSYKSRKIEQEKITGQEKLIEQLKANELLQNRMQHIRNKIAQDLHDDIGSTLSSISILSDLAIRGNNSSQTIETMNEILDSSLMLMERMDDIVWSINPRNDSLENLLMRVRHFATTLFEAKGVDYTIDIARNIHEVRLPMDYRQHIYLILKEAINNLVKYAHATQAIIEVRFDEHHLTLCVRDNGCGFEIPSANPAAAASNPNLATTASNPGPAAASTGTSPEIPSPTSGLSPAATVSNSSTGNSSPASNPTVTTPGGNGLPGMYHRASLMNARVDITSAPGQGTSIRLQVDLT